MQNEFLFLGRGNGNERTFNRNSLISAELQELVLPFAGFFQAVEDERYALKPLLRSGMASGTNGYFSLIRQTPFGPQVNPEPLRRQSGTGLHRCRTRQVPRAADGCRRCPDHKTTTRMTVRPPATRMPRPATRPARRRGLSTSSSWPTSIS